MKCCKVEGVEVSSSCRRACRMRRNNFKSSKKVWFSITNSNFLSSSLKLRSQIYCIRCRLNKICQGSSSLGHSTYREYICQRGLFIDAVPKPLLLSHISRDQKLVQNWCFIGAGLIRIHSKGIQTSWTRAGTSRTGRSPRECAKTAWLDHLRNVIWSLMNATHDVIVMWRDCVDLLFCCARADDVMRETLEG